MSVRNWLSCETSQLIAKADAAWIRGGDMPYQQRERMLRRAAQWRAWKYPDGDRGPIPEHAMPVANAEKWHAEHERIFGYGKAYSGQLEMFGDAA